jgi:hypothetical protein
LGKIGELAGSSGLAVEDFFFLPIFNMIYSIIFFIEKNSKEEDEIEICFFSMTTYLFQTGTHTPKSISFP